MNAPDKIYLYRKHPEPYWFKNKQLDSDVEYIRKDTILKWIEGKMTVEGVTEGIVGGYDMAMKDVIDKINSL